MQRLVSLVGQMSRLSLSPKVLPTVQERSSSFFVRIAADDLWRGVTSVSNAGRKRGRASGSSRKFAKDLNRGQVIGVGKVNMVWPGLNTNIVRGKELVRQTKLEPDTEREERLIAFRTRASGRRRPTLTPLERGWSGTKAPGRSVGPPEPVGDEKFEGFDSTVVSMGMVAVMKGNTGRTRRNKAIVVVGNRNGLVGFGSGTAADVRSALRKAKNQAAKNLVYFERFENHTVIHDFYSEYASARLIVKKKQRGYGLICHRIIREICKLIGIEDIYVKLDGRRINTLAIIRAFFLGLHRQRSFQSVAEEKRLHVVEFREEHDFFPKVVASPKEAPVRTEDEILPYEELDYNLVLSGGKILMDIKKSPPSYWSKPTYEVHLRKTDNIRNQRLVRLKTLKRYGALKSFLTIQEEKAKSSAKSLESN